MKINTFGEFYTFLINNDLNHLHSSFAEFSACADQYSRLCNCKKSQKDKKGEICTRQYIDVINNMLPDVRNQILIQLNIDSISFYYNNTFFIGSISRQ